jgi:hypothetical protein
MKIPFAFIVTILPFLCQSQVVLKANEPGNTYERITSFLPQEMILVLPEYRIYSIHEQQDDTLQRFLRRS